VTTPFPPDCTRRALKAIVPETDESGVDLRVTPGMMYVPPSHSRALDPDHTIVQGIRGAGKSFWWKALYSKDHRRFLTAGFPSTRINASVEVFRGFGTAPLPDAYPGKDVLASLVQTFNPRHIWQSVVGVHVALPPPFPINSPSWEQKTLWVRDNPELYERLLVQRDQELANSGKTSLILFDGLDRLADRWPEIRVLARPLFQLALDLRATRAIRLKLFVRPDMLQDAEILQFPDASKLRSVELTWKRVDLYALLFQRLGNAPEGAQIRLHGEKCFSLQWQQVLGGQEWLLPQKVRTDEDLQRRLFHAISGPTMTADPKSIKRGFPYTWLVSHLMDPFEQVSPRSFLAALETAATSDYSADWEYALSYRSIQTGVQNASRIRVNELVSEEYPWISHVMAPCRGQLTVPCSESELLEVWEKQHIMAKFDHEFLENPQAMKLPPQHLQEGLTGLLKDLVLLGIFEQMSNSRVQMPDVYRIAFGIGRRGGVKPLK